MATALELGIDWGSQLPTANITYFFEPAGALVASPAGGAITAFQVTAYEKAEFERAFEVYESFLDVTFTEVGSAGAAALKIAIFSSNSSLLGAFGPPGSGPTSGFGVFNRAGLGWDSTGAKGPLEPGGYGFVTIIHELGHALGLAHPHDNGGTSTVFPGVSGAYDTGKFGLNQGIYTTMSYNDGWQLDPNGLPPYGGRYGFQGSPMAIDIDVLQKKYGANPSTNSGDTIYHLPGANHAGSFFSCIWDTGGTDAIDYGGSRSVTIQLRAASLQVVPGGGGFISYAHGIFGGLTIAHGVTIENASSGYGNDLIAGNVLANTIDGGGGNDRLLGLQGDDLLFGRAGADRLFGGPGNDELIGGGGRDSFLFTSALGAANADTIADFKHGVDEIELSHKIFHAIWYGALPASEFFRGAHAHDLSDRIIYNPGNGALIYDGNGSHAGGGIVFATLSPHLGVNATDFLGI